MARRDLIITTASVAGRPLGVFRAFSGGEATSADIKSSPGAGQGEVARGGRQTTGNVTITREDDGSVDIAFLLGQRGLGTMVVHRTPTDEHGNPFMNRQRVFTGVLLAVRVGEGDTMADTDLDEVELEMSCNSVIG